VARKQMVFGAVCSSEFEVNGTLLFSIIDVVLIWFHKMSSPNMSRTSTNGF
jgi:hypothetical protein